MEGGGARGRRGSTSLEAAKIVALLVLSYPIWRIAYWVTIRLSMAVDLWAVPLALQIYALYAIGFLLSGIVVGVLCGVLLATRSSIPSVLISCTPALFAWFVLHRHTGQMHSSGAVEAFRPWYSVLGVQLLASGLGGMAGWAVVRKLRHGKRSPTR